MYSPGICPLGFSTAHTSIIDGSITSAQCCPTGYEGNDKIGGLGGCFRSYTTTTTVFVPTSGTLALVPVGPGIAEKFQVVVFYQESDLSLFPSDYKPGAEQPQTTTTDGFSSTASLGSAASSSSPLSTAAETGGGANPAGPSGGQAPGEGARGLTTGAKAGIGIGVAVGLLSILASLFFFWRRRRRGGRTNDLPESGHYTDTPELNATSIEKRQAPAGTELHADGLAASPVRRHELYGTQLQKEHNVPGELSGQVPTELAGPEAISPTDLAPAELASPSVVKAEAPAPSATEEPTPVLPLAQHEHSPLSGHHPVPPSEVSSMGVPAEPASGLSVQAGSSQPMPTTIEELKLQYLESEARRIQQRKDEILRTRESKLGEGS